LKSRIDNLPKTILIHTFEEKPLALRARLGVEKLVVFVYANDNHHATAKL
jgi:hypothetical protein